MQQSNWATQERWISTRHSKTGGHSRSVPHSITCGTGTHLYALLQIVEDHSFQHESLSSDDRIWQCHIHKEGLDCSEACGWGKAKSPPRQAERLEFPLCSNSRCSDWDTPAAIGAKRKRALP